MLFASCENTFSQAFQACFGTFENEAIVYFEVFVIEGLFLFDLIFCFFQEYKDEETYTIISDVKKIAKHYVRGSFIFDLLAIIPFQELLNMGKQMDTTVTGINDKKRLYKLIKLLRVPRLFELLNVERIRQLINDHYNQKLQHDVLNGIESEGYPILKALMYLEIYKIFRLVIIIFTSSYFLGILWHIYVCDFEYAYMTKNEDGTYPEFFGNTEKFGQCELVETGLQRLIKMWYFALTTLSTIGFGDMSPVSIQERLIWSFVLMFGVAIFSLVMSQFIDILLNYKKLEQVGDGKDLSKWIALLSRFNNGNPINKDLINKIEDFFEYYWTKNRLAAVGSETGQRFMSELPQKVQQ